MKALQWRKKGSLAVLVTLAGVLLGEAAPQGQGGWLSRQRPDADFGMPKSAQTPGWAEDGWGISLAKLFPPWDKQPAAADGRFYLPALAFDPVVRGSMARPGTLPEEARLVGTPWTTGRVDLMRKETESGDQEQREEESPVLETPQPHSLSGFLAHLEATRRAEEAARRAQEEAAQKGDSGEGKEETAEGEGPEEESGGEAADGPSATGGPEVAREGEAEEQSGEAGTPGRTGVTHESLFPRPGSQRLLDERILLYFPVDADAEQKVNVVLPGESLPRFQPPHSGMRSTATFREEP